MATKAQPKPITPEQLEAAWKKQEPVPRASAKGDPRGILGGFLFNWAFKKFLEWIGPRFKLTKRVRGGAESRGLGPKQILDGFVDWLIKLVPGDWAEQFGPILRDVIVPRLLKLLASYDIEPIDGGLVIP